MQNKKIELNLEEMNPMGKNVLGKFLPGTRTLVLVVDLSEESVKNGWTSKSTSAKNGPAWLVASTQGAQKLFIDDIEISLNAMINGKYKHGIFRKYGINPAE